MLANIEIFSFNVNCFFFKNEVLGKTPEPQCASLGNLNGFI